MRYRVVGALLAACLCQTGCSLFAKKAGAPTAQRPPDNPPAQSANRNDPAAAQTVSSTSQINGVLAGQVLDRFNRRPNNVYIRVVDLEDTRQPPAAAIEKAADDQGYFTIVGLRPGGHYQLVARVQDGDKLLSGTLVATPPNPRLSIFVSEDNTTPSTPAIPTAPIYPGKDSGQRRPAALLDPPVKDGNPPAVTQNPNDLKPNGDTPSPGVGSPGPAPTPPSAGAPDLSRTADGAGGVKDGFRKFVPPAERVNIDGPSTPIPPPPTLPRSTNGPGGEGAPRSGSTSETSSELPGGPARVPSCVLVGRRLENFALYDEKGETWEYRRDRVGRQRTGRLLLIDFWYSTCGPCLEAVPHLVDLHRQYGPWGLEVVGIAYEKGTIDEQVARVRGVRGRYGMRYPTLLGTGSNCPVRTQFGVDSFPTLVLIDENGDIVWRSAGLDERGYYELVHEIRRRLGVRTR